MTEPAFSGVTQRLAAYIDRSSDEPVSRQIIDRLWLEIITGTLEEKTNVFILGTQFSF